MSDNTSYAYLSKMRIKNLKKKGGRIYMEMRKGPLEKSIMYINKNACSNILYLYLIVNYALTDLGELLFYFLAY